MFAKDAKNAPHSLTQGAAACYHPKQNKGVHAPLRALLGRAARAWAPFFFCICARRRAGGEGALAMQREGQVRIPSGCAVFGVFAQDGARVPGDVPMRAIAAMRARSNGLGGGFAGYGIYPEYKQYYALHVFYDDAAARAGCEAYLERHFDIINLSKIPTRAVPGVTDAPLIWRYFVAPLPHKLEDSRLDEAEYVARRVIFANSAVRGAYIFSCGRNMGVFKAVGYPEDVGRFYRLDEYAGYAWTAHGRYPTNTPGWWGGAHPFALLDLSVVHNGEISSYDANRRAIEMHGYQCSLLTDTEVITYILDYLVRRQGLTLEEAAHVIAAPFWGTIASLPPGQQREYTYLRHVFASLLVTGPFSILVSFEGGMMALNDRLKLRSMVVAQRGSMFYAASEEAAIRTVAPQLDTLRAPRGGEPVIVRLNKGVQL